jgi:hypothetical protein
VGPARMCVINTNPITSIPQIFPGPTSTILSKARPPYRSLTA